MLAQTGLRISRYQPHTEMSPHQHDEPSIGIVVSGMFLERIGRDERTYSRGTASYCPAATTHSQIFGATGVRQIIFKPDSTWLDYLADSRARLDEAPHAHSATFRDLGDKLLGEMRQGDGFSAVACEGIMLEIIAAFGRKRAAATATANPPAWLRAAREFCTRTRSRRSPWRRSRAPRDVTKFILRGNSAASSELPSEPI